MLEDLQRERKILVGERLYWREFLSIEHESPYYAEEIDEARENIYEAEQRIEEIDREIAELLGE
jgi:hypothetical protein